MTTYKLLDHETLVTDSQENLPVLVLLHCIGTDHQFWQEFIPFVKHQKRIITYDLRGFGYANTAPSPKNLKDFATDLKILLEKKNLHKIHLAGVSLGGMIAQSFATHYPDYLLSLGLIASPGKPMTVFQERADLIKKEGLAAQAKPYLARWFSPDFLEKNNWAVQYMRRSVENGIAENWIATWHAMDTIDSFDKLNQIKVPICIIGGELDKGCRPEMLKEIADQNANARLHIIPNSPHLVILEKPQKVARLLLNEV